MMRNLSLLGLGVIAAALSCTTVATAQITKTWTGGSGDWDDGTKWSGGSAPGINDVAVIAPNDGVARTINFNSSATLTALYVDLAGAGAAATTFSMPNGSDLSVHNIWAGGWNGATSTTGRGIIDQSTGIVSISPGGGPFDILDLGVFAGSTGTYNLSGGTLQANAHEYVGDVGTGFFNQTGGTNSISGIGHNLFIGGGPNNGVGTYTISNSDSLLATVGDVVVGNSSTGTGTLTIQNQASVDILNNLTINSHGTVNLDGGTLRFNAASGLTRLNYTAGTIQLAGNRTLDSDSYTAILFGSPIAPPSSLTIPSGKGLTVEGTAYLIQPTKSTTVSGGTLTAANMIFGNILNGVGTLIVNNGGTVNTSTNVAMGDVSGSSGVATLSGAGSSWNIGGSATVGSSGLGTLTIQDQSLVYVGTTLSINGSSTVNLQGGTLRFDGITGANRISFSAGTIQLAGSRGVGAEAAIQTLFGANPLIPTGKGLIVEGTATLTKPVRIDGGKFQANGVVVGAGGAIEFDRGILEIADGGVTGLGSLVIPANGEFRTSGVQTTRITGLAGSTISATSYLTLGDDSKPNGFYTNGDVNVGPWSVLLADANDAVLDSAALVTIGADGLPGELLASHGLTLNFGGNIVGYGTVTTIDSAATPFTNNGNVTGASADEPITLSGYVKGVGTLDNVVITGTDAPGFSPATVTRGSVLYNGTLEIEIGGNSPGSFDQINHILGAGVANLGGTLDVALINGFMPSLRRFVPNHHGHGGVNGTFTTLPDELPAFSSGLALGDRLRREQRRTLGRRRRPGPATTTTTESSTRPTTQRGAIS